MPIELLAEFLTSILFVFFLSALLILFTIRSPSSNLKAQYPEPDPDEESSGQLGLEDLAEDISLDKKLLASVAPVQVPHIELPGAIAGGGARAEARSKTSGKILLRDTADSSDKRKFNRRMRDRRSSDVPVDDDQRALERRIWLRREEDRSGKKLLTVSDAADTLGVPVEQIYKWLDKVDIPFYQVTDGRKKAIRFEINELLQWYTGFISNKNQ